MAEAEMASPSATFPTFPLSESDDDQEPTPHEEPEQEDGSNSDDAWVPAMSTPQKEQQPAQKQQPTTEEPPADSTEHSPPAAAPRGSGCGVVGFLAWVGSLLLLASLAAYASLLLAPEPAVVGGSLADGPPAVLAHQRSGMRVKVPTRGRQSLNLFVVEHGDKHAQETVLLLHGLGSSSYTWRKLAPLLANRGLRVVAVDMPGSGLSDKPAGEDYSPDALAAVLASTVSVLGLRSAHVVAHDTAGMYAAKYALAHPSRVRSLNLLDSPLDAGAASLLPLWILWLPGAPQMLAINAPIALTAMVLRSCCARTLTNEEAEAHLYLALYNHGGAALAAQAVSADAGAPRTAAAVRASLRELSAVPMQVMWAAEHCTAEHMRQKEYIVSTFNLRQKHEFGEGVGPWPHEDAAKEVADVIVGFVDTLEPMPLARDSADDVPEHVRRQFEAMAASGDTHAGCSHGSHGHGHDSHGHSHAHDPSHGHSHSHQGHSPAHGRSFTHSNGRSADPRVPI